MFWHKTYSKMSLIKKASSWFRDPDSMEMAISDVKHVKSLRSASEQYSLPSMIILLGVFSLGQDQGQSLISPSLEVLFGSFTRQ